jgi:hypothetical protein
MSRDLPRTIAMYDVNPSMRDQEIRELVLSGFFLAMKTNEGGLLTVGGYGHDPRDLWDIPEVVNFARKLVSMGVMSILTMSTYLEPRWGEETAGKPFGAFELWLLAKGRLGSQINQPELKILFQSFSVDLADSNDRVYALCEGRVGDGNHKP